MSRLKKILGSPFASIVCFLFAIGNRIIFSSLYSIIGRDTMVQLTYAENFMAGKGLGVTKHFITDLNHPVFDTQQLFPPGYSLSIIPFLSIFHHDHYKAVFAHDIITVVLFITAIRFVGKKIGLSITYLNMLTIVAGCSQYPFFTSGSATDAIALSFLLFALGTTIGIAVKKEPLSFLGIVWVGVLFFLPSFYRFMYMPITVLLPIQIFLTGLFSKNNKKCRVRSWCCCRTVITCTTGFCLV